MLPKVKVLILSFNGKCLLNECISSYLLNDYGNYDVTVIDNGSSDGTKQYVNENWPGVFVLRTENNLGYSGGFNLGLDFAFNEEKADYVLITNNDVKVDLKAISKLIEVAKTDPTIGFVTGKVYYYDRPNVLQSVGYYEDPIRWIGGHLGQNEEDNGQHDRIKELPFSDDIFMLVGKNLYKTIGGYDVDLKFQGEQFDWQIRGKQKGFKVFYTPWAMLWHKDSMTIGKTSALKTFYNVRNSLIIRFKHRDRKFIKSYLKWYIPNVVLIPFTKNLLKLRLRYSWAILTGFISAIIWEINN